MKKFFLILTVICMVVLDLILRGESIVFGLILIAGAGFACYGFDQAHRSASHTPSKPAPKQQNLNCRQYNIQTSAQ